MMWRRAYQTDKILHSSEPRALWIEELRQTDEELAIYALAFFLGQDVDQVTSKRLEGAFRALLFTEGVKPDLSVQRAALEQLRDDYRSARDEATTEMKSLKENAKNAREEFDATTEAQKAEFATLIEESRAKLNEIEKTYDQKLSLQAPVDYWEKKRRQHLGRSISFGLTAAAAFAGVLFGLIETVNWLFGANGIYTSAMAKQPGGALAFHTYWGPAVLVVMGAVAFWVLRIVVRLFLSNVHLHTDAAERSTMVLTYLSLLRSDQALNREDRELILKMLFRPTATGIVKDDAAPPSIWDFVTRAGTPR